MHMVAWAVNGTRPYGAGGDAHHERLRRAGDQVLDLTPRTWGR